MSGIEASPMQPPLLGQPQKKTPRLKTSGKHFILSILLVKHPEFDPDGSNQPIGSRTDWPVPLDQIRPHTRSCLPSDRGGILANFPAMSNQMGPAFWVVVPLAQIILGTLGLLETFPVPASSCALKSAGVERSESQPATLSIPISYN